MGRPQTEEVLSMLGNYGSAPHPYSGRGMSESECVAVRGPSLPSVLEPLPMMGFDDEALSWLLGNFRWDQLGDGVVVYWPELLIE